ncbi:MAG: anti-sigma factor family protein [Rubripirellula sp.]
MSLPPALIDQLLTGYLDEVLSADELARVETLLKTEPSIAAELVKLQEMRSALKAVALADSDIRLDAGFAERVIDEAVLRARSEGVSDEHPLLRIDKQPVVHAPNVTASSTWRIAAVMVGLAASIALAVFLMRSEQKLEPGDANPQIAEVKPVTPQRGTADDSESQLDPASVIAAVPSTNPGAGSKVDLPGVNPTKDEIQRSQLDENSVAGMPNLGTESNANGRSTEPVGVEPAATLGAILVINVELTAEGRERDVFNAAMKRAGLKASSQKKISDEIVGITENPSLQKPEGAAVVYLQAPAKDLDRLYLGLIADRVGVKSVGMSLAMDAPVMRAINAVRQDPTTVRHESSSLQLLSDDDTMAQLTDTLLRLEFMGMRNGVAVPSTGGDQMAEILLLVK